jgi:polyisoprenoid-binding protein YceI
MKFQTGLMLLTAAVFFAAPAIAGVEIYKLESPHTQVMFNVSHLGFTNSYGKFTKYDGEIVWDQEHPEKSKVTATINTDSLQMNDATWNEHLSGENFFDIKKFPTMTFTSKKITVSGEHTAKIDGDLTLRGVTKPVTLDVTHNKSGKFPFGNDYRAGFSATAAIKRSDFGMTYGLLAVGDDVKIILEVESVRQGDGEQVN